MKKSAANACQSVGEARGFFVSGEDPDVSGTSETQENRRVSGAGIENPDGVTTTAVSEQAESAAAVSERDEAVPFSGNSKASPSARVALDAASSGTVTDVVCVPNASAANKTSAGKSLRRTKGFNTANIAKIAVLTALSYILYLFVKFPLPMIFPGFLDIQFSDLPALVAGFSLGPAPGCFVILVKCLLKLPFSSTVFIGEVGDIFMGIAFVLPASLIYRHRKRKSGAVIGLLVGMLCSTAVALVVNRCFLIPFYGKVYGFDALINMTSALYPGITRATFYNYYLWLAVLPFNVLRLLICGILTFLVYKPLSKIMHWEVREKDPIKNKIRTKDVLWQIGSVLFPFAGIGFWAAERRKDPAAASRVMVTTIVGIACYLAVLFLLLVQFKVLKL